MTQQTAVESFWNKIALQLSVEQINEFLPEFQQAKAMEKEQTIKFAYSFYDNCFTKDGIIQKTAGEYYNQTYNK